MHWISAGIPTAQNSGARAFESILPRRKGGKR
jgi:hypothetical protein